MSPLLRSCLPEEAQRTKHHNKFSYNLMVNEIYRDWFISLSRYPSLTLLSHSPPSLISPPSLSFCLHFPSLTLLLPPLSISFPPFHPPLPRSPPSLLLPRPGCEVPEECVLVSTVSCGTKVRQSSGKTIHGMVSLLRHQEG